MGRHDIKCTQVRFCCSRKMLVYEGKLNSGFCVGVCVFNFFCSHIAARTEQAMGPE